MAENSEKKEKFRRFPIQLLLNPPLEEDTCNQKVTRTEARETAESSGKKSRDRETNSNESEGTPTRLRWTPEEDEILLTEVRLHGPRRWDRIAERLPGRNGQHVRLRYANYLKFSNDDKERSYTSEEDRMILAAGANNQNKWSQVAKEIRRGNNDVKNRYYLLVRRISKSNVDSKQSK
uniref:Uncharacterized protein n=1 Tax=Timspurckia oligopyrenoides TaxID=708627 RepID=A0A7S0ZDU4_9RHOD|mmetsp:Transcript_1434/g.2604  ORF Transcript_1434/g.2604 Transcript_1434/m.2604 type:complete len:178 (+) Transcript_1434:165-698(+)|eukprot:CAMPEP_0182452088 /NCGR_PEP_ID=MMETSP1172-20130603/44068_1 /TAXON_ID=708627 /ORGANISM="Timspurckia oligopyrenoides, Strain CCMP3278" /LENGTH=177 /DNA_ID=CAMNT_0024649905 /DNA_START=158 /DNA_END=691 /DNA_ORIENTATION=+